jgi:hypothetical protein
MIRGCYYKLCSQTRTQIKAISVLIPVDVKAISLSFRPLSCFLIFFCFVLYTVFITYPRCVLVERTDSKYTGYDYSVS